MERAAGMIPPHKNSAGRNTDPHRQKRALGVSREHIHQIEGDKTSAYSVILTCSRIAEIDKRAIAQVLGNITTKMLSHAFAGLPEPHQNLAPILRFQLFGEKR
jgi:hypothetical protein